VTGLGFHPGQPGKRAASVSRALTPTLTLAVIVDMLPALLVSPFLPAIANDLATDPALVGQVAAAATLLATAIGFVAGALADRHGRRRMLEAGLCSTLIGSAAGLAPSYLVFMLFSLVAALGRATVMPVAQAVGSIAYPEDGPRRRVLTWTSAGVPLASIAGVPLLTALGGLTDWRVAFLVLAILAAVALVLVRWIVPQDGPWSSDLGSLRASLNACWQQVHHPVHRRLHAASFVNNASIWSIITYLGLFYVERYGFALEEVAWVFLVGGLALFLGAILAGQALRWGSPRAVLVVTRIVGGVLPGLGLIFVVPAPVAAVLLAVGLLALGIGGVVTADVIAMNAPDGPASVMTVNGSALSLGLALGAALGGLALSQGGYAALGGVSLVFGLLSPAIVLGLRTDGASAQPETDGQIHG
jgi:predicted MFS family arabinose efflux permease